MPALLQDFKFLVLLSTVYFVVVVAAANVVVVLFCFGYSFLFFSFFFTRFLAKMRNIARGYECDI